MRVGFENNSFGGLIGAESEGASADEGFRLMLGDADVPGLLERAVLEGGAEPVLGENADATDVLKERSEDFRGGDADGEVVDLFHEEGLAVDGEVEGGAVGIAGIVNGLECEEDVVSGEGGAIRPANARAKKEVESFVVLPDFPAGGEAGFDFLGDGVEAGEGVEEESDEAAGGGVFRDEGVEGGGFARGRIDKNTPWATVFGACDVDAGGERMAPVARRRRGSFWATLTFHAFRREPSGSADSRSCIGRGIS